MASTKQLLPCVSCSAKFSEKDVKLGNYFISTMVCKRCYLALQAQPHKITCFGKPSVTRKDKIVAYGYDKDAPECSTECPDRLICKAFVRSKSRGEPAPA